MTKPGAGAGWVSGRRTTAGRAGARGAAVLVLTVCAALGQVNLLSNGGFELGDAAQGWYGISNWTSGEQWGGILCATNNAQQGTNVMKMFGFGSSTHILSQRIPVSGGTVYEVDGWLRSAPAPDAFDPTNGYVTILVQWYNGAGSKLSMNCDAPRMKSGGPTTFTKYTTGPMLAPQGSVSARVSCLYYAGNDPTTTGLVDYDDLRAYTSQPTQVGALLNPDFEMQPFDTLTNIPYWKAFGNAGIATTNYDRSGRGALQLYYTETLLGQTWPATAGKKYSTRGYLFTPTADRFSSTTNAHGVILLQFLDSTATNVLQTYESAWFWATNAADTWTYCKAEGFAPGGAVYGRTMCAILGAADGFGGSIYFDDMGQQEVSTSGTVAGVLHNPGFDDGPPGNAYYLSNNLPYWAWYGGSNAGFVVDSVSESNGQSLAIVYPGNLAGQDFAATTGLTYTVEGYMMTPSSDRMTSTTAYATFLLEFFTPAGGATSVSVVSSVKLTNGSPADTWIKVGVTNRAPWVGAWVTGRVSCALLDLEGTPYGGTVYFDSLRVTETTVAVANTQSGALWNPGFEYTPDGTKFPYIDNWTNLGVAGNVDSAHVRSGDHALKIYAPETLMAQSWDAEPGYKYAGSAYVYTPADADRLEGVPALHASVLLQFFDSSSNLLLAYESPMFTTNNPAGVWTNLPVTGVAPAAASFGRTVVALLGTNTGFGGAVYFDDAAQSIVSTQLTSSGLLYNPGYDDGPPGNAYDLDAGGDLPAWHWSGGTNAGYIASDHKSDGEQALVITYPQNSMFQDWAAASAGVFKAEGYLFTPSTAKFNTDGSSYGELVVSFFVNGSTNPADEFTVHSATFGASRPADTWVYFSVTGTAPAEAVVTGRLSCTIYSPDPGSDFDLGGVIYFDQLSITRIGQETGVSEFAQWQIDNFGTTNGPDVAPEGDYDDDGFLNWSEFIAGTQPTNGGSLLAAGAQPLPGGRYVIRWPSANDRYYSLKRSTNIISGSFGLVAGDLPATVPENVYTDMPPAGVEAYYYRVYVTTNQP